MNQQEGFMLEWELSQVVLYCMILVMLAMMVADV